MSELTKFEDLPQILEEAGYVTPTIEAPPELFDDLTNFIEAHVELTHEAEYDIIAAKILETYMTSKINEVGYLNFVGPPRSGKTRALETIAALASSVYFGATMTTSTIYRILDDDPGATFILDEIQQYLDDDKAIFLAILNSGQRRGLKAWINVPTGRGWKATGFEVFGPKFLATTQTTAKSLATRCITIPMTKNTYKVKFRIDKKWATELKQKIHTFVADTGNHDMANIEDVFFEENGFNDSRTVELFYNLVALAPPKAKQHILDYAKELDEQISEEDGFSFYAEIYAAVQYAIQQSDKPDRFMIADVAEAYNDGREPDEILSNRLIGTHLNLMGLRRKCRGRKGLSGRFVSPQFLKRLDRRYGRIFDDIDVFEGTIRGARAPARC